MKAILEFNLPEDSHEFKITSKATNMYSTLYNMDQWLRSNIKYASDDINEHTYKAYEECREKLHQFLTENNVDLE
jgi:hypothetical protein